MSSMIIPIGFGGAGASGGGSYIQVYADAPQYIEGKYLRVSLGGDEIYAGSIPTNVDAITLQITEAGTYTIAVYASSSASTATESHTVLVDNLNASPSVHFGTSILEEKNGQSYGTYYYPSTSALKTGTKRSESNVSVPGYSHTMATETWTSSYGGAVRFEFNVTGTGGVNLRAEIVETDNPTKYLLNGFGIGTLTSSSQTFSKSLDLQVEAGVSYTIRIYSYSSSSSSYTITYSNTYIRVLGTSTTKSTTKSDGIRSKAVKSVQTGVISNARYIPLGQSGSGYQMLKGAVTISEVDPEKSILIMNYNSTNNYSTFFEKYKKPEYPNMFLYDSWNYNWMLIEFY